MKQDYPVEHLTAVTYAEFTSAPGVGVVHFWAEWATARRTAQDRALGAAVDRMGGPGRAALFDTDDTPSRDLLRELHLPAIPTLFHFRDGQRVAVGAAL